MRNGKGITDGWLAKQLEPFAIRPRMMRIGQVQARGYFEEDLAEVFRRYIPRAQMEALRAELEARLKQPMQVPDEPPANSNETPPSGSGPGHAEVRPEDESEPGAAAA